MVYETPNMCFVIMALLFMCFVICHKSQTKMNQTKINMTKEISFIYIPSACNIVHLTEADRRHRFTPVFGSHYRKIQSISHTASDITDKTLAKPNNTLKPSPFTKINPFNLQKPEIHRKITESRVIFSDNCILFKVSICYITQCLFFTSLK